MQPHDKEKKKINDPPLLALHAVFAACRVSRLVVFLKNGTLIFVALHAVYDCARARH